MWIIQVLILMRGKGCMTQDNLTCQVSVECEKAHFGRSYMGQLGMQESWSQENYSIML